MTCLIIALRWRPGDLNRSLCRIVSYTSFPEGVSLILLPIKELESCGDLPWVVLELNEVGFRRLDALGLFGISKSVSLAKGEVDLHRDVSVIGTSLAIFVVMTDFEEPLFGCFSDLCSCAVVWCVPLGTCCIQAQAVSKATGEGMVMPFILPCLLGCIGGALNRGKIRDKYKYAGSFILDCLLHCLLTCCAVTQEYREVNRQTSEKKPNTKN